MRNKPYTKILVDGGDPDETKRIEALLGFKVDGQTTNPTLIARNPEIAERVRSGSPLSKEEENQEYQKIVRSISPVIGDAGVSIEVYSDFNTTAEEMIAEAREKFSWIPNAYIKFPTTKEGLQAAQKATAENIRCNMTLCFTQAQAAAVYAATIGAKEPVYVSPFIGRLDDIGLNGIDLVKNIKQMYAAGDGHVHVLAASIRSLDHLLAVFALKAELATVPTKILEEWATKKFPMPDENYLYAPGNLKVIPFNENISLSKDWQDYDISSVLTEQGIKKFVDDYNSTLKV